jgi:hypothetical protein
MFDEMVTMTERLLVREDQLAPTAMAGATRLRATLMTAMASGIPLFHEHLSRALGIDVLAPEGDRLVTLTLIEMFAQSSTEKGAASPTGDGRSMSTT